VTVVINGREVSDRDAELIASAAEECVVPCGTCSACCRSVVAVRPDRGDNPADYECAINVDISAPNRLATLSLNRKPDGSCYALIRGRCSIWEKRPYTCRTFDCRKMFAMFTKDERRGLIRDRYFTRDIFEAGKQRLHTLPEADELRAAAARVGFGPAATGYMDSRRGVKKEPRR
jgi:Fe-S-cluster containining protein